MMNKMSNFRQIEKSNEAVAELIPVEQKVELTGSPKQIAWAKDLRHKFICKSMDVAEYEVEFELYKPYAKWLVEAKTEAKWWIDNRFNFEMVNRAAMKEFGDWCRVNDPEFPARIEAAFAQIEG